uniref:hypothetical protein n=1 Tax=Phaeobacter italicus TaxID=481446 RepID=UPI00248D7652
MADLFDQGRLERIASDALRSCIKAHGPVTKEYIGSAAKRMASAVRGMILSDYRHSDAESAEVIRLQKELDELKTRY